MESVLSKEYKKAFSEVCDILKFTDSELVSKIPKKFMLFLEENKDKDYISDINPYISLDNQNLQQETKNIIALIYRKYMATDIEKEIFSEKDKKELAEIEEEKINKYKYEDIFKSVNDIKPLEPQKESTSIVVIKEKNIFQKLLLKIKNFFKKNNY